jgi:hypothetical protein
MLDDGGHGEIPFTPPIDSASSHAVIALHFPHARLHVSGHGSRRSPETGLSPDALQARLRRLVGGRRCRILSRWGPRPPPVDSSRRGRAERNDARRSPSGRPRARPGRVSQCGSPRPPVNGTPLRVPTTPRRRRPSLRHSGVESARPWRRLHTCRWPGQAPDSARTADCGGGAGLCTLQPRDVTQYGGSSGGRAACAEPTSENLDSIQEGGMQKSR